jgi:hypothetical protein
MLLMVTLIIRIKCTKNKFINNINIIILKNKKQKNRLFSLQRMEISRKKQEKNMIKLLVNVVHSALQLLNAVKNDGKAIKHCVIVFFVTYQ